MKKVNFHKLNVRQSLADNTTREADISHSLADLIYTKMSGMAAHSLAHKLFETEGEVELSDEECAIILSAIDMFALPYIIDAVHQTLNS